jgi:hypothetical protein
MKHELKPNDIPEDGLGEELGQDKDAFVNATSLVAVNMIKDGMVYRRHNSLESFVRTIESEEFDNLGFRLESPQDYFTLGVMFEKGIALTKMARNGINQGVREQRGGGLLDRLLG